MGLRLSLGRFGLARAACGHAGFELLWDGVWGVAQAAKTCPEPLQNQPHT